MHAPRPYGLSNRGAQPTGEDLAFIDNLVRRLSNLKEVSGLPSVKMIRELPDGGLVIVHDAGGILRAVTDKPPVTRTTYQLSGFAEGYLPMLFCGVITKAVYALDRDKGIGLRLTTQTRRRLLNYSSSMAPERLALERFEIKHNDRFSELKPSPPNPLAFVSQYANQRPTWYSGAMGEVMQIVGGYGRQDLANLPEDKYEQAFMELPEEVVTAILKEMGDAILPAYYGMPPTSGQFQYDYKFHNTNLVGVAPDGTPWLLRVSGQGVYAMPLPMIPATCTAAFHEYVRSKGDHELERIIERFGGLPSGENMPANTPDFEAWRRAGVVIKICDTADFYQNSAYYTACGWSSNLNTTEIVNTCFNYEEGSGWGVGATYKGNFRYGGVENGGRIKPVESTLNADDTRNLSEYVARVKQLFSGNSARSLAVQYKLRRVPQAQIMARTRSSFDAGRESDYWENLELEPIAKHSGSVRKVYSGYVFFPSLSYTWQPQIKFPEPYLRGCVSHDFSPTDYESVERLKPWPKIDTVMFAYFAGDDLKVVKYFQDWNTWQRSVESDADDCMVLGSWKVVQYNTPSGLAGNFYTSDIDKRMEFAEITTTTNIKGTKVGHGKPWFQFDYIGSMQGAIGRNWYWTTQINTEQSKSQYFQDGLCVPYFFRNAVLHAVSEGSGGGMVSEEVELNEMSDPYIYRYWTYDPAFASRGGKAPPGAGSPEPKKGQPVWAESVEYLDSLCGSVADHGEWLGGLPADVTWLVMPKAGHWRQWQPPEPPGKVKTYRRVEHKGSTSKGEVNISNEPTHQTVHRNIPDNWYFSKSPKPDAAVDAVFYRDGAKNLFGDATYSNTNEPYMGNQVERKSWGKTVMADNKSAHHFIGVINE